VGIKPGVERTARNPRWRGKEFWERVKRATAIVNDELSPAVAGLDDVTGEIPGADAPGFMLMPALQAEQDGRRG
jgi:hypothetical protein